MVLHLALKLQGYALLLFFCDDVSHGPYVSYVQIHEDLSDDEDLENAYISDEEELMNNDSLLNSLRHGVLPPEISVLYALCLIQEGGRNFIAKKCMDSLAYLVQEPVSWLTENRDVDSGLSKDPSWLLFRLIATEPLGRTAAFALLADVLHKSGKEEETTWSTHFAPLFGQCLEDLKRDRMLDVLHNNATGSLFPILKYRRDMLYKIILGFGRLKIQSAKANLTRAQEKGDNELVNESVRSIWDCLKSLKEYLSIPAQKPLRGAYGSLSAVEIETLELFTCGHTLLLKQGEAVLDQSTLEEVSNESDRVIAWLCGTGHAANSADEAFNSTRIMNWKSFPISSTWQSPKQKAMSLRCYNLCVAHNVSHFSGWDLHEFSLGLINQKGSSDAAYFGLHLEGEVVSGFLPATVEQELMHQWNRLSELESVGFALDLSKTLADVKERQWYKDGLPKYQDALHGGITAKNCEGPGLEFFLAYSGACLDLAQNKERDDESIKRLLIMNCLSILLPITQFCLEKTIWSSDIGKLALRKHKEEGWRQISRKKSASSTPAAKPPRRNRSTKLPSKSFVEWFHEEDAEDPMSNVVTIPASQLKSLWGPFANSTPEQAKQVMAGVHESMVTLRASRANANVEKASLQVAVALLQLVKEQCCENPFIVLQQAAIFASHGSKRGNNDAMFREALPEPTKCTPEDALTILGRADCFLSVQFPYESAFLCNYVARVCSSQRKSKEQWNNQWMVVGILCYHLSVLIRSSAETVLGELFKKEDYDPWDEDIVDELLQGRADALQWKMGDEYGNLVVSQMQIDDAVFEVQADDDLPSRQIAL